MNPLEELGSALRGDGWSNPFTGVGTAARSKSLDFAPDARLPDDFLEQLFIGDPYASRICRVVPEEALRQGFRVKLGDPTLEAEVHNRLRALHAPERLRTAWTWARVFGGGAVFVGADDGGDPEQPLDRERIESVRFLIALDRRELMPQRWYRDPLTPKFGEPEVYLLQRQGTGSVERAMVHESRLIRFEGLLSTRNRKLFLQGWGESELQRIYGILQKFNGAWEAAGTLLHESSQGVFKMKNLFASMAADKRDLLRTRLEMMDLARSVTRSILVDADTESFERTEVGALTGLASVLDKFLLLLSGAAEIPVTILMGQSPAGLSATGESDVRWFYDRIKSAQVETLAPALESLVEIVLLAQDGPTNGMLPDERGIEFAPLWQMTPLEDAQLRNQVAQTDAAYITAGVLTPEEVTTSRFRPAGWNAETSVDLSAHEQATTEDPDAVDARSAQHAEAPEIGSTPAEARSDFNPNHDPMGRFASGGGGGATHGPFHAKLPKNASFKGAGGSGPSSKATKTAAPSIPAVDHPTTARAKAFQAELIANGHLNPAHANKVAIAITQPNVPGAKTIVTVSDLKLHQAIQSGKIKLAHDEELGYAPEHEFGNGRGPLNEESHVEFLGARWALDKHNADGGHIGTVPYQCPKCKKRMTGSKWIHTNPNPNP